MALRWGDRVADTTSAPGTGNVTTVGSPPTGFIGFESIPSIASSDTFYYGMADVSGANWEVGLGTVVTTSPFVFSRSAGSVLGGSAGAGALTNFSAGTQNVWLDAPAGLNNGTASTTALSIGGAGTGAAATSLQVYNTWSSSGANYECGVFDWTTSSNVLTIGTKKSGTGTSRSIQIIFGGTSVADFNISRTNNWTFAGAQSTYGWITSWPYGITTSFLATAYGSYPIGIGGSNSASYPGLINSGTTLKCRLSNDSADAAFLCASITLTATSTPASAAATGTTGQIAWDASYIYVCTATNTWKRAAIATW